MKTKHIALASIALVLIAVAVLLRRPMEGRAPSRPLQHVQDSAAPEPPAALEGMAPATPFPERPRQSEALHVAPTEEPEGPTTATAQITRGDGATLDLRAIDGEFMRVGVEPKEVLTIRLALVNPADGQPIRIDADNGGSLNRQLGPLTINPQRGQPAVEFRYAIGGHRGKYTLLVTQGDRQELLEFYAGPERAVGRPGPLRTFNADERKAKEARI
jgi:hypothetical protein